MKTTKYLFLLLSMASLFLHSCDEDSFSQVVTIDVPEHEPQPVVLLQIDANQEHQLSALVSNSKGILDPESTYEIPTDAEVKLFKDGTLFADFEYYDDVLRYEYFTAEPFSNEGGVKWELQASIPGFDPVAVEQVMPPRPFIESATYEVEGTIDAEGYRVDELIVDVRDVELGVTNYYGLALWEIFVQTDNNGDTLQVSRSRVYLDTNDPLLSYANRYDLVFTDEGFSNNEYQVRAYTYYSLEGQSDLEVTLYQLTEDAWLYARSLEQYNNAINNPFAEPVTIHSNVDGGFGVFSLTNRTVFPVDR